VSAAAKGGTGERLGVTLLFALVVHAVVALGVTFGYDKPAPSLPSLDVILVQSASGEKPDKADYLAQANNSGGGTSDKALRPSDPLSGALRKSDPGLMPQPLEAGAPAPKVRTATRVVTQQNVANSVLSQTEARETPPQDLPEAQREVQRKLEMARLSEEIQKETQTYAKRPKKKFISANTKEYAYASYMRAWVARIERIGNLNYPDEARREQLHGSLVLTVALKRDGSVKSIEIIKSSGIHVLDEAATRIVTLAAPFPPIPSGTGDDVDELFVTRTWQFLPGDVLRNE
jgi:protein TonB